MADIDPLEFHRNTVVIDGANHSNDFNPVTDEGWFVPADFSAGSTLGTTYPFS